MLRWASERAASSDPTQARTGVAALAALSTSELLQGADQDLVDAVIDSIIEEPVEVIEQLEEDVEVIEVDDGPDRETLSGESD